MSFSALLVDAADLQQETVTTSSKGAKTITWSTLISQFRCRFRRLSGEDIAVHKAPEVDAQYRMYCEPEIAGAFTETRMRALVSGSPAAGKPTQRIRHTYDGKTYYYSINGEPDDFHFQGQVGYIDLTRRDQAFWAE